MKNTLMITFKDLTQQLKNFGLAARLQKVANTVEDRKIFEQEFSIDEAALADELISQSEVVQ